MRVLLSVKDAEARDVEVPTATPPVLISLLYRIIVTYRE